MTVQDWLDVVVVSLQDLWRTFVGFLPELVGAIVVFIVGLIVAAILERLVERAMHYLKLDALLRRLGVESYVQRAGMQLDSGKFLGAIAYWFIVIAFLLAASDILQFFALSNFLRDVLLYIPNIAVAVLIMVAALIVGNFLRGLVKASVMSAKLHAAKGLGALTWWVVVIFGLLAALSQLGIAVSIINAVVTGLIAMLALAGGLAFGLGGREMASRWIQKMEDEMMHRG